MIVVHFKNIIMYPKEINKMYEVLILLLQRIYQTMFCQNDENGKCELVSS